MTKPHHQNENLPVPVESTRNYCQITPTDDPLRPDTVATQFRRLHQLDTADDRGRLKRLLTDRDPPTIECRIASDGGDDATLRYLFGIDEPDALDALQRTLRGLFPNTYELTQTSRPTNPFQTTDEQDVAAVEFLGKADRRNDWQTRLTPFESFVEDDPTQSTAIPLGAVAETMATADCPIAYQALLQPKPDWSSRAQARQTALRGFQDTIRDQFWNTLTGAPDPDDVRLPPADQTRIEELEERDARRSFVVNARVVAVDDGTADAEYVARELASTFAGVSHTTHAIDATVSTGSDAQDVLEHIQNREFHPQNYESRWTRLPVTKNTSRGIVADASEAPSVCCLGGEALTAAGARAVGPTPGERTALPRPPFDLLEKYRGEGMLLGHPLTQDGTPDDEPLVLPPSLQPLHVAWFGKTGSGKSTSLTNAILQTHAATDGADVVILPKGAGMATQYLQAHYATFGTLDNVCYFDCSEVLPAFSFFDIRDELAAGVPRTTAVEDTVDHYVEILRQIMGPDRFEQAVRSPDVIRYLVKALFDPVSGDDAISHRDLHAAARRMHERQTAPPVADEDLEHMLAGVVANSSRTFDEIMQGVVNRIEKIPVDRRLARVFNHVADDGGPHFDLGDYLNDDAVVIFDTGDLRTEAQRVLALVVLSNLWTALRRRARDATGDQPLVNLYVDEAASVATSDLLDELLAQARGFDCAVTLAAQFPGQLRTETGDGDVLNNVSTFVTGNVPIDRRLARRLATDDMGPEAVGNRLRALERGQWLVGLPAAFGEPEPQPFLVESASPPPGDPAGTDPLSRAEQRAFDDALATARDRTTVDAGLTLASPSIAGADGEEADDTETAITADAVRTASALPHTNRMPPTVGYDDESHALRCTACENRYDPTATGMRRAIECHDAIDEVDRADVPVCDCNLKLTPDERATIEWTDRQLLFLQVVYDAQQLRHEPLEYDLIRDSMLRLQEYVGLDSTAIQELIDAGLVTHDTDHPHRLWTVTPDGRSVIGESYRRGIDYGHGKGDLEESSQHVLGVVVGRRWVEQAFVQDPASEATQVLAYYDLDRDESLSAAAFMGDADEAEAEVDEYDPRRLDVAGLDDDGNVVVALEVERVNNDVARAVPDDYDKMAACDPEAAIWVVMTQSDGHEVLQALNDPPEGEPRVEKTYADTTPPQQFRIDTPGMTAMYPVEWLRDRLDE